MAHDADHPTLTRTRTRPRTLWRDLCFIAVACDGSGLIRPKGDAVGAHFKTCAPRCKYIFPYTVIYFERSEFLIATCKKKKTDRLSGCVSGCSVNIGFSVEKLSWF